MKLIIQIPAYNEETTLPEVFRELPHEIAGIDEIEVLVIDDGSTDRTTAVAEALGAHHVVRHTSNKGLAAGFQTGLDAALRLGADIIVNTDADNQYPGDQIVALVEPILARRADIVIGDRQTHTIEHFSTQKRILQRVGSWVVRRASNTEVPDSVSGFRALSREAALRIFVTTEFSYTVENLIQAGKRRLTVAHVPIRTNQTRPSRLHSGNWNFVKRQASTIVRTYATYEPLKTFSYIAAPFLFLGIAFLLRAAYVFVGRRFFDFEAENLQSLTLGTGFLVLGFIVFLIGLVADRIGGNRRMLEEVLYRIRRAELEDIRWRQVVETRIDGLEALQDTGLLVQRARGENMTPTDT
ncbi:MAG: glycosyltransferase family 2 protein [Chloroflexota bacterium]|nr:glycosyltransferase family 2 protein [Chloroflexota bacterium]PLS79186.1 MAG: glycosyl transferase [Chloroflexota bacterium]